MRTRRIVSLVSALALASVAAPALVSAQTARTAPQPPRTPAPPQAHGALVFVLTTGMEDLQTMNAVFRHARTAAEQRRLQGVAVLVYGRGVQALDGGMAARPAQTAELIREAMAAGVRVQVCGTALTQMGVARERLDPQPTEVVPNAIVTLVDHVARGAAVVRY